MKIVQTLILSSLAIVSLLACTKDVIDPYPLDTSNKGESNIKIVYASAYNTNYSVQLKLNDTRISSNITYSTPFPGGGLNTGGSNFPYYMPTIAGQNKIAISIPKARTNIDSIALSSGNITLDANKYYSVYTADTAANTQLIAVEDKATEIPEWQSKFKFINLMPNAGALDLYFQNELVAANIAYKSVSPEFSIRKDSTGFWRVRPAGSPLSTAATAVYPTTNTGHVIPNKQALTVYARGYVGATGNRLPAVSLHQTIQ